MEEMFHGNRGRSLREVAAFLRVHHISERHVLGKQLKWFPYGLQIGQQRANADKQNWIAFYHFCKQNLEENWNILGGIVLFDECSFSSRVRRTRKIAGSGVCYVPIPFRRPHRALSQSRCGGLCLKVR